MITFMPILSSISVFKNYCCKSVPFRHLANKLQSLYHAAKEIMREKAPFKYNISFG